jgi:hypothetical protein
MVKRQDKVMFVVFVRELTRCNARKHKLYLADTNSSNARKVKHTHGREGEM